MSDAAPSFFVLLMPWGRVGSNLVTAALNALSYVSLENEPTTTILGQGRRDGLSTKEIQERQDAHLDRFIADVSPELKAAGLKLAYNSLVDPATYLTSLRDHGFTLTVMVRRNFLKCAVSQQRALARAQLREAEAAWASPWSVKIDEPKPGPVAIDVEKALNATRRFEHWHNETLDRVSAVFGEDYRLIEYEDLAAAPEATVRSLLADWGLPQPEVIAIRHRKATSEKLSDDITNYQAFADAAVAGGFERFL